jgi:hypothetical protein
MAITIDQVRWGSYKEYEGPWFHGVHGFKMPDVPDEADRYMAIITAAEGGHYDSINMYDRGIVSVGIIQYIEAGSFNVSNMLGHVIEKCGSNAVMIPLKPALDLCNATFKKNALGLWRFHFNDARGEVNTSEKSKELFLGCSGLKQPVPPQKPWTPETKERAKLWTVCMANVWSSPMTQRAQHTFIRPRLPGFVMADAKAIVFDKQPSSPWVDALRAAFMSFAINLPLAANNQAKIASATLKSPKWSEAWCIGMLKQLTFGPNITIYATRYNNIRPLMEKLWGISLPKTAKDLLMWREPIAAPTSDLIVISTPAVSSSIDVKSDSKTPDVNISIPPVTDNIVHMAGSGDNGNEVKESPAVTEKPTTAIVKPTERPASTLGWILWAIQALIAALAGFSKKK